VRRRIHEIAADALAPQVRLHEQAIELTADDGRKSDDMIVDLRDDHLAVRDLRRRQVIASGCAKS
jgi:rRNA pseudouridine-1189 N-methylase Emg1 (Nep1/Mra1 family)